MLDWLELVIVQLGMSIWDSIIFKPMQKYIEFFNNKKISLMLKKYFLYLPSSNSKVTVGSTYSHQCFPSVDTGISQLDHLQAKWMHTHAITVGLYWRQKVVRCRLLWSRFENEEPYKFKYVKQRKTFTSKIRAKTELWRLFFC